MAQEGPDGTLTFPPPEEEAVESMALPLRCVLRVGWLGWLIAGAGLCGRLKIAEEWLIFAQLVLHSCCSFAEHVAPPRFSSLQAQRVPAAGGADQAAAAHAGRQRPAGAAPAARGGSCGHPGLGSVAPSLQLYSTLPNLVTHHRSDPRQPPPGVPPLRCKAAARRSVGWRR